MKKIILTVFSILSVIAVQAQFFVPRIGVSFNHNTLSVTSTSNSKVYNAKAGVGFMLGIGYNARLGDRVSFQPEVYYLQRNFKMKYVDSVNFSSGSTTTYNVNNVSDTYRIGYLEIPLLLKFKFLHDKMFFTFGPFLSIGLGGGHDYSYVKTAGGSTITSSGTDRILFGPPLSGSNSNRSFDHRNDIGFQPGLGVIIWRKLQVEARWDYGTKNISNSSSSRNETLMFLLSYPLSVIPEDE